MKRALRIIVLFVAFIIAADPISAPIGVSVRNATSPRDEKEAARRFGEALSPELNRKLAEQFPPGSDTASLVRTLTEQGFKLAGPCENDPAIHRAQFLGPTRGCIFQTQADIYWKTQGDSIVWTKGFVFFIGL